jgi:hypothetical protein
MRGYVCLRNVVAVAVSMPKERLRVVAVAHPLSPSRYRPVAEPRCPT